MTTKRCFKCQCEKPLEGFYKHAQMGDGHLNKCKDCTKADVKRHRQESWETVRAYDRMRASQPHRVATRKRIVAEYEARFPQRKKAVQALNNAVRDGKVKKQPCWVCGEKAVAHHPDYDQPLDVVWLCQAHHRQTHALVANDPSMQEVA
jgi:glutamate synthase domain-containing protein 2